MQSGRTQDQAVHNEDCNRNIPGIWTFILDDSENAHERDGVSLSVGIRLEVDTVTDALLYSSAAALQLPFGDVFPLLLEL